MRGAEWYRGAVRTAGSFFVSIVLAACAGGGANDERGSARARLEPTEAVANERGPTRAAAERELREERGEPEPPPPAPMVRRVAVTGLDVVPLDAPEGEDGRGAMVPATDAVALDVVAPDGFPGRALDPVLYVGQLRFTRYSHPTPDRMRFVVADRAVLPEGAEVALQWGDDRESRVVVTPSLEVGP